MRDSGCKLFLATNSNFSYSNAVMNFLFDVPLPIDMVSDVIVEGLMTS